MKFSDLEPGKEYAVVPPARRGKRPVEQYAERMLLLGTEKVTERYVAGHQRQDPYKTITVNGETITVVDNTRPVPEAARSLRSYIVAVPMLGTRYGIHGVWAVPVAHIVRTWEEHERLLAEDAERLKREKEERERIREERYRLQEQVREKAELLGVPGEFIPALGGAKFAMTIEEALELLLRLERAEATRTVTA